MIRKAKVEDLDILDTLSVKVILDMQNHQINQWQLNYPRKEHLQKDIEQDALFVYVQNEKIIGVMALYQENDPPYKTVNWLKQHSMVVHRIFVDPDYHQIGVASKLLYYAIKYCKEYHYESLKIDTHPANYRMRNFLKKHQFHELDYIKVMHRIAFERVIEHKMNRIIIFGASGTGKTTLSKMLGEKLHIPYIHLDTIYWLKDWQALDKKTFAIRVRNFLKTHPKFVIDGNYTNSITFEDRIKLADTIIMLDFTTSASIKGIVQREKEYKHRYRSDMAEGCIEKIDQEFLEYVYNFEDKKHRLNAHINQFIGEKNILIFKDRKSLMTWFNEL
ncbi:MAG: GNAT family N-acetyltransferase [Candidatus Izemoplasmataceae bacterium]